MFTIRQISSHKMTSKKISTLKKLPEIITAQTMIKIDNWIIEDNCGQENCCPKGSGMTDHEKEIDCEMGGGGI